MVDPTSTSHITSVATSVNTKSKRKARGVTMCTKVEPTYENGVRSLVNFDLRTGNDYSENVDDFKGYVALQDRTECFNR